jgi:hypothetical protein
LMADGLGKTKIKAINETKKKRKEEKIINK